MTIFGPVKVSLSLSFKFHFLVLGYLRERDFGPTIVIFHVVCQMKGLYNSKQSVIFVSSCLSPGSHNSVICSEKSKNLTETAFLTTYVSFLSFRMAQCKNHLEREIGIEETFYLIYYMKNDIFFNHTMSMFGQVCDVKDSVS